MSRLVFPGVKAIGELEGDELRAALEELGDEDALADAGTKGLLGLGHQAWKHTTVRIGRIAESGAIVAAAAVEADASLREQQVDVRLDRLRVYSYPGSGKHEVMVTFEATHQHEGQDAETLTFSQAYQVQEGQGAGVSGYPIFRGLRVGAGGLDFRLATVTVRNSGDEALMGVLRSGALAQGLGLLTTAQPALAPFVQLGRGIAESVARRNQNRKVQEAYLGLDFDGAAPMGIRLRCGTYVVLHCDDAFKWSDYVYDRDVECIVAAGGADAVPYNYLIFRVAPHAP